MPLVRYFFSVGEPIELQMDSVPQVGHLVMMSQPEKRAFLVTHVLYSGATPNLVLEPAAAALLPPLMNKILDWR